MAKLPRSALKKFTVGISRGGIPEPNDTGYDDFFDAWRDLWTTLGEDWSKAKVGAARREVAALVEFSQAVPVDGLVIGSACNQPGIVPVALAAARSMKLPELAAQFEKIAAHIPEAVPELDDPGDRMEWYKSKAGKSHASALDKLEDRVQDEDITVPLMLACVRRIIAEPNEFFAGR